MSLNIDIEEKDINLNQLKQIIFLHTFSELQASHLNNGILNEQITNLIFNNISDDDKEQ